VAVGRRSVILNPGYTSAPFKSSPVNMRSAHQFLRRGATYAFAARQAPVTGRAHAFLARIAVRARRGSIGRCLNRPTRVRPERYQDRSQSRGNESGSCLGRKPGRREVGATAQRWLEDIAKDRPPPQYPKAATRYGTTAATVGGESLSSRESPILSTGDVQAKQARPALRTVS